MVLLLIYIISDIIAGCIFLSWYIFKTKNSKENKQLRQDNKKLKTLLQEAVDKNNRLNCEKTELLKLINKLQESNKKNISSDLSTYESIRDSLQTQNTSILMNLISQNQVISAGMFMAMTPWYLRSPYQSLSSPQYPYTW